MGRTMPTECEHGRTVDLGDFGPDETDGSVGAEVCERCEVNMVVSRRTVAEAVTELDTEHQPQWSSPAAQEAGKKPIGCVVCFPQDGSWPCTSRLITGSLRSLL